MSLDDKVFGGVSVSPATEYIVSWIGVVLSLFVAVYAWFIPADGLETRSGKWILSLIGLVMFAVSAYGNRYFRKRMRDGGPTRKPPSRR